MEALICIACASHRMYVTDLEDDCGQWIRQDLTGSGRGLLWSTFLDLARRNWGKLLNPYSELQVRVEVWTRCLGTWRLLALTKVLQSFSPQACLSRGNSPLCTLDLKLAGCGEKKRFKWVIKRGCLLLRLCSFGGEWMSMRPVTNQPPVPWHSVRSGITCMHVTP